MLGRLSGTPGPAPPPHLAGAACPAVTPTDPCRWCHGDAAQAFRERTVLQTFLGFRTQPAVALPAFPGSCPPFGSSTDGPDVTHQLPQPAPLERSPGQTTRGAPPLAVWGGAPLGSQQSREPSDVLVHRLRVSCCSCSLLHEGAGRLGSGWPGTAQSSGQSWVRSLCRDHPVCALSLSSAELSPWKLCPR